MNDRLFFSQLEKDALRFATRSAKLLQKLQKGVKILGSKVDAGDLVTNADIASERLILEGIRKKYPDHAIFSEESGRSANKSDYLWVVDPLDGTKEYARGLSEYNCLISVERGDKIVAGVVYCVGLRDIYAASKGNGAEVNGKPIHVSKCGDLKESFIGFHTPERSFRPERLDSVMNVQKKLIQVAYRVRPGWNEAKLLGWIARGVLEAHIIPSELHVAWGDVSAGILLVQEAGGKVTDWSGKPLKNHDLSRGVLASNGKLHSQLLNIINSIQ